MDSETTLTKDERTLAIAAMLEALAYAIEEGEATDVPMIMRMIAAELRN